jgi:transposase
MEEQPIINVKRLGHLGIIAAIFKEYKIVELIDSLLPKPGNHQFVTHGEAILAMVMQGLGFSNHRLYLSAEFFSHVAIEGLFSKKVKAEHFTSEVFAGTLDAIFKYGPTKFFTDTCFKIVIDNKLLKKFLFIDTSTLCATGKKYKNDGNIELKYGYSKDYRMDLKQLVYLLVTTEDALPIFAESHSGNASDNDLFQKTIIKVQELLKDEVENEVFVLDAALYSAEFLLNKNIKGHWLTRVPESVKMCKDFLESEYDKILWTKIDKDYKFLELKSHYGGVEQRWLLVRNREAKYKEIATFKKQLEKENDSIGKIIKGLEKKIYFTVEEAAREIENRKKHHLHFIFTYKIQGLYEKQKGQKRKIRIGFMLAVSFKRNEDRIIKTERRKGKFIIATACLDDNILTSPEMLSAYRGRNKNVEGCYKFIKDKTHNLNQIFLKKESRIEAMVIVMSIILFINNLAQLKLREHLVDKKENIPTQLGKTTEKPTFKWASYLMMNITKVKVEIYGKIYNQIKGIEKAQEIIIRAFGKHALDIYGYA